MCGVFGFIGYRNVSIKQATEIIEHRGPDSQSFMRYYPDNGQVDIGPDYHENETGRKKVLMGFRRLSILDLSREADQPFIDTSGRYIISFNGEIYNYLELKEELKAKGYEFRTQSDTEVLLNSFIEWKEQCLAKFNGMWSFVIFDLQEKECFFSRDRFGIKPLYYYFDSLSREFYWASEIKQLFKVGVPKNINERVVKDFLQQSILDHSDQTFFEGIFKVPSGSYFRLQIEDIKPPSFQKYWKLKMNSKYDGMNYQDSLVEMKRLFFDSINLRFRSDVQVGSCLSGGLDSSSIVSSASVLLNSSLNTFTSCFEDKRFDESEYVRDITDKYPFINSKFCTIDTEKIDKVLSEVLYYQDEPFASMGVIAQWEVMKLAKENDTTVILDGQGGDELLGGYRKYYAFYLKELLVKRRIISFLREGINLLKSTEFSFFDKEGFSRYLGKSSMSKFYSPEGANLKSFASIGLNSARDFKAKSKEDVEKYSYPILLRYEDRNSMAHSVESRVPFLDYRLVEFLFSMPSRYLIRKGYTKAILRDSMYGVLPDSIRLRKSKLGFATPQTQWMNGKLGAFFKKGLASMNNPFVNAEFVALDFSKYPRSALNSNDFFRLYIFDKWYDASFN